MSFEKTSTLQNKPIEDIINGCTKCNCGCTTCNSHQNNPQASNEANGSGISGGNYGASINS